jgi:hypothetical protein
MAVEKIVASVAGRIGKPPAIRALRTIKNFLRGLDPVHGFGGLAPKSLRVFLPSGIDFGV